MKRFTAGDARAWNAGEPLAASQQLILVHSLTDLNDRHLKSDAIFTLCDIDKVGIAPDGDDLTR